MIPRTSLIIAEDSTTWYEIWNQVFTVEFEEQYYSCSNSTNQISTIPTQVFTFGFGKVISTDERPEMSRIPLWAWTQGQQSFINDDDVQYTRNLSHPYHVSDRVTFE